MTFRVPVHALVIAAAVALGSSSALADTSAEPFVTSDPEIAILAEPEASASLTASADGSPAPAVQWQFATDRRGPWTDVPGANGTTLDFRASEQQGSPYALGNAFRAVFTNSAGTAVSRPARLAWRAQWMRDLGSDIANVPLNELTIPGSHDMGTYGITGSSVESTDGQAVLCGFSFGLCERYGRAQDPIRDAEHELNDGIRYFDLRVCGRAPFSLHPPGTLLTCHGLEAAPLQEILDQTRSWLDDHPGEVVFLDFNHHYGLSVDVEAEMIEQAFATPGGGSMLIPPEYCTPGDVTSGICASRLTLTGIATRHLGRVIANFVNDTGGPPTGNSAFYDRHPLFWGRTSSMPSAFGASPDVSDVLPSVLDSLRHRGDFDPEHFYVQFLQTTPDGGYIAGSPAGSLLLMALDSNPVIGPRIFDCGPGDECLAQFRPENLNILAINFYNRTEFTVTRNTTMSREDFDNCLQHDARCPLSDPGQIGSLRCALDGQTATCQYLVDVHFDLVEESIELNAYARTPPVVEVSAATPLPATGWYNAASLGGHGSTLRVDVLGTDYRYPTGMSALDCLDNTMFHALIPGTNAPFARGHLDLGDGVHMLDCRATDGAASGFHQAGNRGAGPNSTSAPVIFRVDTVPPAIHCSDAHFLLNQPATLTAGVSDATSGPGSQSVSAAIATAQVGRFSAALTASDIAGNTATAQCSYTVSYGVDLRYDSTKPRKTGSVVSISIRLVDYFGTDVSDKSIPVHATSVTRTDAVATLVPIAPGAANSDFAFVVGPGSGYLYNLETKGYAPGSYTLDFVAGEDPITHKASFLLR
jgi:hypothetical protein